jgi:hypothetical protein
VTPVVSEPDPPGESSAFVEATPVVPSVEEVAAEAGEAGAVEEVRRYPSTIGGAFYILILVATAVGIGITWSGNWRVGVRCIAGALILAATLRLVLPRRDAGMLAVRHRIFDVLLLGGVGGVLLFLVQTIPDQPGF